MPKSQQINGSKAKASGNNPLIFISHDSRDADLAEAFSKLLTNASSGALKSFRSSDFKGSQGIEYGTEWFKEILKNLRSASYVVCLVTERSVNRPWILYEAGVAKGKSGIPVIVVAIGISLSRACTGPFAPVQNCDAESEEKLTKLVLQLASSDPHLAPPRDLVQDQVETFMKVKEQILKGRGGSTPDILQRLADNWNRHNELHPDQLHPGRFKLYSFCGITDEQSEEPFADLEDVYFLWADASKGSSIAAQVLGKGRKRKVRISFNNERGAHASNVAFRIRGRNLLYKEGGFAKLRFCARIPTDVEETDLPEGQEVQLGIRIVDALNTHWIYAGPGGYRPLFVNKEKWVPYSINLSYDPRRWSVFDADGNSLYHDPKPDFSMLLAVIIEVGSRNAQKPGSGKGILEIKEFAVE